MNDDKKNNQLSRRHFIQGAAVLGTSTLLSGLASANTHDNKKDPVSRFRKIINVDLADITKLTAVDLSIAIKSKVISCRQVMRAYLDQIDKFNVKFNAIVSLQKESDLMAQADQCDVELSQGKYRGWMHGFPLAVKDLASTKGILTTRGSLILKDNIPEHDDIFVEKLKAAGGIIIGKTNVPEVGLGSQSYNRIFGTTLNAFDAKSTAGGSSGGAAVSLALNMLPIADGSDMMGSLRNPAAFNNVIGFRPSFNRVPSGPSKELFMQQLGCAGPMGKTVTDTAMLLSTMAGHDSRVPLSSMQDPAIFATDLKSDVSGLRIGWLGDFNGYLPMEKGVLDVCKKSLKFFEKAGCIVENVTVDYPMEKLWQTWLVHRHFFIKGLSASSYADENNRKLMKPELLWEIEKETFTGAEIFAASMERTKWYNALHKLYEKYDFLVVPSAQVFPFDAEIHWPKEIAGKKMDTYHRWMEVVIGGTLSGCPALNVPAGFSADNKPMGMQIWGPMNQDLQVLKIGYAYEQASRWNLDYSSPFLSEKSNS